MMVRYILLAAFSSWRKTLTMTGVLLFIPAYNLCMENNSNSGKQEVEQSSPKFPMEEFLNNTVKQYLVNIINEYDNSEDENRLKIFLKQFLDLQLINKQVKNFLVEHNGKKIKYFAPHEPLIVVAAQLNSNILCELILQNSKVIQEELDYALIFAATNQNKKIFDLLIKHGAKDVLLKSKNVQTTATALLENGSSVLNDSFGWLDSLAMNDEYILIKFFLLNGENVNCKGPCGTALYHANFGKYYKEYISELLLRHGADSNLAINNNQTPLILTTCQGNGKIIELLLKYDADKAIKFKGKTAYDFAISKKHFEIAELLK